MKRKTAFVFSAFFGIAIMTMACSRSANENAGNRRAANVTSETPTPSSTPTPTPENQSEHIRKLLDDFSGALTRGDVDALGNIYSDGFLLISDNGRITTKPD